MSHSDLIMIQVLVIKFSLIYSTAHNILLGVLGHSWQLLDQSHRLLFHTNMKLFLM